MRRIAKRLTNYILAKQVISEEDRAAYEYGFQAGLEQSICVLVSLCIAACMNRVWECVLLLVVFFLQRAYVKGIHLKQYWSCFLLSCGVVILGIYLCGRIILPAVCEMVGVLGSLFIVQMISEQFAMDEDEKAIQFYSKQKRRIAWFTAALTVVMFIFHWEQGLFLMCYVEVVMLGSTLAQWGKEKCMK